jgi:SSS family solute:Na+ symporter
MIIDRSLFRVDGGFALGSAVICVMLAAIYGAWW